MGFKQAYLQLLFTTAMLLAVSKLFSQTYDIGAIQAYQTTKTGISGSTESSIFSVRVYNSSTIRVTISLEDQIDDFSYAMSEEAIPIDSGFHVLDSGNLILIQTEFLFVEIEKQPLFRITFRNKDGLVINEDMPGKGFGTGYIGKRLTMYKKLQPGERFVGLGEVLGNLDKRGTGYLLNNTDTYKYGDPRLPMYISIPFYIGIHSGEVYGIFSNNTYKSFFNFGLSTPEFSSITLEGGNVDYFFIYDHSIAKLIEHYTYLTGRMPLPPLWSIGYHQSRCSYFPQDNVLMIAETFRRKKLPADCIVLDADYLHEYEPFRINEERFPDMPRLTKQLHELGFEVTASVNPGIKIDTTYFAHLDGLKNDIFIKYTDGKLYTAEIAPSLNNYPDFTNPIGREWWIKHMQFLPDNGIYGTWNDMNEPAVGGSYLPDNLVFDFDGHKANALRAKNVYGMQMARSSYEASLRHGDGRRPFILSRSGFAGIQRYATVWTGDNTASDEYLLGGTLLNTQMGLSGVPFVGDDLGGYIGHTSKELFIRWMQTGTFSPFMRNHKEAYAQANEPWSYGEEAEAISRTFLEFRYMSLPYLYSKFYEASTTGMPIARSLCIDSPHDPKVYDHPFQYQFLYGDALLVIPVTSKEKVKKIYLPTGKWYNLYNDELLSGNQELNLEVPIYNIPLFIRESSIIPMQKIIQNTKEKAGDTLFIHVYNGQLPNTFEYYEDDGYSMGYRTGEYYKRKIQLFPQENRIFMSMPEGNYPSRFSQIKFIMHGFPKIEKFMVNNKEFKPSISELVLLDSLKYLKDLYDAGYYKVIDSRIKPAVIQSISFTNSAEPITINW